MVIFVLHSMLVSSYKYVYLVECLSTLFSLVYLLECLLVYQWHPVVEMISFYLVLQLCQSFWDGCCLLDASCVLFWFLNVFFRYVLDFRSDLRYLWIFSFQIFDMSLFFVWISLSFRSLFNVSLRTLILSITYLDYVKFILWLRVFW